VNTLIVLFNLRPEADVAAYEQWAKSTDLPIVRSLGSVSSFNVYRSAGLFGSGSPAPYSYIEVIDVSDLEQFGGELGSDTMRRVAGEFQKFADNPVFILSNNIS
jgi:hypothetical protein